MLHLCKIRDKEKPSTCTLFFASRVAFTFDVKPLFDKTSSYKIPSGIQILYERTDSILNVYPSGNMTEKAPTTLPTT